MAVGALYNDLQSWIFCPLSISGFWLCCTDPRDYYVRTSLVGALVFPLSRWQSVSWRNLTRQFVEIVLPSVVHSLHFRTRNLGPTSG